MEGELERKPHMRRGTNFIVEENVDTIQWPHECAVCGGPVEATDSLELKKTFKALGKIQVKVAGIPYCQVCLPKIHRGKMLDKVVYVVAFVLGIPIGLLLTTAVARQPGTTYVCCGLLMAVGLVIGYGLSWLIIKFPVRLLFKKYFASPVDAWLIEEKKSDGKNGMSVVISIPNKNYADKFAQLNGV